MRDVCAVPCDRNDIAKSYDGMRATAEQTSIDATKRDVV